MTYKALRILAADLRDLALDLQAGTYTRTTVAMFERDLRQAVPSALGATITFSLDSPSGTQNEINLLERTLDPAEIAAGLRIPLILPQQSLSGSILFYASEVGAFDGVVEDLVTLLHATPESIDASPMLPTATISPSVVNIHDFSLVNDALGVLINRGYSLTEARSNLHDRATRHLTSLPGAARMLLDGLPTRRAPRAGRLLSLVPVVPSRTRPRRPAAPASGPERDDLKDASQTSISSVPRAEASFETEQQPGSVGPLLPRSQAPDQ